MSFRRVAGAAAAEAGRIDTAAVCCLRRQPPQRPQRPQRRAFRATGMRSSKLVVGTLAVVGIGGAAYYSRLRRNKQTSPEELNQRQQEVIAKLTIDELRRDGVTLYRYLTCPFCGKVQAFLERFKIPYQCVEVDPLTKAQLADVGGYSKVPVVRIGKPNGGGPILVDSFDIVSALAPKFGAVQDTEEVLQWRKWAADIFVRFLTLNLNRSLGDAYRSAAYIDVAEEIPWVNRMASKVLGSITMWLVVQVFITRPKLIKMTDWDGKDERKALYDQLNHWASKGLAGKEFHGGRAPDSADTDVYGILNAIRGYPAYIDALRGSDPAVREWVGRMDAALGREPFALEAATAA
eukprot:TRINITY_DN3641_c0_g2_i1.p1 TRINITY_DN3641_c0_g2~~TRINITY_DN3641_c0_g2_i1.p1  ORF type:complete len:349 (+),score=114.30 TRINITY_DN3641_c0_g2_i1:78-1124(+)